MLGTESQPRGDCVTTAINNVTEVSTFCKYLLLFSLVTTWWFLADVIFTCFLLSNCNGNYDTQLIGGLVSAALGLKAESNYHICSEM